MLKRLDAVVDRLRRVPVGRPRRPRLAHMFGRELRPADLTVEAPSRRQSRRPATCNGELLHLSEIAFGVRLQACLGFAVPGWPCWRRSSARIPSCHSRISRSGGIERESLLALERLGTRADLTVAESP